MFMQAATTKMAISTIADHSLLYTVVSTFSR